MNQRKRPTGTPPALPQSANRPERSPQHPKPRQSQPVVQQSVPTPQPRTVSTAMPMRRHYPFLSFLRIVYAVLAAVVATIGIVWLIVSFVAMVNMLIRTQGPQMPLATVFSAAVVTLAPSFFCLSYGLFLMALSEGIRVVLDIQHNTLTTARELRSMQRV